MDVTHPSWLLRLDFLPRHNVNKKVEHVGVRIGDRHRDVVALQRSSLVSLRVDPGSKRDFADEELSGFGKQYRRFSTDHHVL